MAESETTETEDVPVITLPGTAGFGEGELGQIRNLLLGQHARDTAERVAQLEDEVLATIAALRSDMDQRFGEIESRIAAEVDTRTSVATNLVTRIDEEAQSRRNAQIDLRSDIERRTAEIRQQIGSARTDLGEQIDSVDADLRERSVDRDMLSNLFEVAAANLTNRGD